MADTEQSQVNGFFGESLSRVHLTGPLCLFCDFWIWIFMGFLHVRMWVSASHASLVHFLWLFLGNLFLFQLILFYHHSLDACLFSRNRKGVDPGGRRGGEKLERSYGGEETEIRIHCLNKIYFQ